MDSAAGSSQELSGNSNLKCWKTDSLKKEYEDVSKEFDCASQLPKLEAPTPHLPLEVLGEIIALALPDHQRARGYRSDLLVLCQVCSSWRLAATLVPRLWTTVEIWVGRITITSFEGLCTWFGHSGDAPKTLIVESTRDCTCHKHSSSTCEMANPALCRLLSDSEGPKLTSLTLEAHRTRCLRHFNELMFGREHQVTICSRPWDFIQSLSLVLDEEWDSYGSEEFESSIFNDLPLAMTSLALDLATRHGIEDRPDINDIPLQVPPQSLSRLTTLELLWDWPGTQLFKLLKHCPELETLHINPFDREWEMGADTTFMRHILEEGLTLPKLHTIRLLRASSSALVQLKCLKTPAITDIDIEFGDFGASDKREGRALEAFLDGKSKETLRSLQIRASFIRGNPFKLTNILRNLPNLTRLTLDNVTFDGGCFTDIIWFDDVCSMLSVLELLKLPHGFDLEPVRKFAERRGIALKTSFVGIEYGVRL